MKASLYWMSVSHPAQAARKMLELKGVDCELIEVLPGLQRIQLRLVGFRGGTVPALKLDGRRVQGSRRIARALEEIQPQPPLFPADPELRARVEQAEAWGDEELQEVPRRIFRWGTVHRLEVRQWLLEQSPMPAPAIVARLGGLNARYYAHVVGAAEGAVRRDLAQLPRMLDRVDALLSDGTLTTDQPNAATFQLLCSVRLLDASADLHDHVSSHLCARAARELFPDYPEPVPAFLPRDWLTTIQPRA
jgi:glutathione S-transferase